MKTMFENFLTNLKNHSSNLTDSLKVKTRRLTFNFNSFKEKIVSKPKTTYYTISRKEECDHFDNDYLSPRAYSCSDKWPSITENMQWVPYVPPKLDEQNIVDRFIKVITIDDDNNDSVSYATITKSYYGNCILKKNLIVFYRGVLIEKRLEED